MNFKAYLANIGMTVKDFSELVDCNRCYLSMIVSGKIKPGKRLAKDIETVTNGAICLLKEEPKQAIHRNT